MTTDREVHETLVADFHARVQKDARRTPDVIADRHPASFTQYPA